MKAAETVAALDPGREKCGLAVLDGAGSILLQRVIQTPRLEEELEEVAEKYAPRVLAIGNGTTGKDALERIRRALPSLPLETMDEYRTTHEARKEYWKAHPPTGWRRLLPTSMQVPPVPVDDFVAVILARRVLEGMP